MRWIKDIMYCEGKLRRAAKPTTCTTCEKPIEKGALYWLLGRMKGGGIWLRAIKNCMDHEVPDEHCRHPNKK